MATIVKNKKESSAKITIKGLRDKAAAYVKVEENQRSPFEKSRYYYKTPFSWATDEITERITASFPDKATNILTYDYKDKGETKCRYFCPKCGHTWDAKSCFSYHRGSCPSCANSRGVSHVYTHESGFGAGSLKKFMVLDATDEYMIAAAFFAEIICGAQELDHIPDAAEFEEISHAVDYSFSDIKLLFFHKNFGLKAVTPTGSSSIIDCYNNWGYAVKDENYKQFVKLANSIGSSTFTDDSDLSAIFTEFKNYESASAAKAKGNAAKRELMIELEDKLYLGYKRGDEESLFKRLHIGISTAKIYDSKGTDQTALGACPLCGKVFVGKVTHSIKDSDDVIECPCCGENIHVQGYYDICGCTKWYSDWNVCDDSSLIVTHYSVHNSINEETMTIEQEIVEEGRDVFTAQKAISYYKNARCRGGSGASWSGEVLNDARGRNDLKEVISKSVFAKSGLIEALGKGEQTVLKPLTPQEAYSYLIAYYKYPVIEQLVKCGMFSMARYLMLNNTDALVDNKATTVQKCLGLTNATFKMARENDLNGSEILMLKSIYNLDNTMTYEDFDWLKTSLYRYALVVSKIMEATNITLAQARKYLTSCYYDQCIPLDESVRLWDDYIKMMKALNFSSRQIKKELFPTSLKKSHDILNFASRHIVDEDNAARFGETIEGAKKYRYESGNYILTTPEAASDIIREGIELNHSVAQHIEMVVDKMEYICFIRRKDTPTKSLYTVELVGKDIVQVRGNSNRPILEEDVKIFLKKWAKAKKLEIKSL